MPEWIGQTIGKVRVDKYLARGGMAEVYLGTHLALERSVAIKVLHSFIESDPELLGRFQREAKAAAGLHHPNIVQIYDFDTYDGHPYIVMEYLNGPSLSIYLHHLHKNNRKLSLEQIGELLRSIVAGIDFAHSQGVIHRDIKPANIILRNRSSEFSINTPLSGDVEAVITDFGLARITRAATQTASGFVSGTPAYMSPEQARGDKLDHRTDNYSIGVILFEMLAGRVPFEGDSSITVMLKHINEAPPRPEGISPKIQSVLDKALAKNPDNRYSDNRDLVSDYYRAISTHNEAKIIPATDVRATQPVMISRKKNQGAKKSPLWVFAGIFVCACISFLILGGLAGAGMLLLPRPTDAQIILSTTEIPATARPPTITGTPSPTITPEPTSEPTQIMATPTLIVLPQQWNGIYTQAGIGQIGITIIIEKMNGDFFTGKMIWLGTSKFRGATTRISGQYVNDFGDALEQAKWGNHPDYKNGDRSGAWIKWTEDGFVKGSGYTLGGWYYGHIRDIKTMVGIYYLNDKIISFASSDTWELNKK